MEAAIIGLIGRIAPLLFGFLQKKYKLLKDLEDDIWSIKYEFEMISATIAEGGDHPVHVKRIEMVRDLAREIEDCIDDYTHRVHKISSVPTKIDFGTEINRLKKKSVEARELIETYKTKNETGGATGSSTVQPAPEAEPLVYSAEPVGMEAARRDLMELINVRPQGQPKKLKVISIVGIGGIGKSQLADYAYNNIDKSEYPERAWVAAAGKGAGDVLKEIHRQLQNNPTTSGSSGGSEGGSYNLRKLRGRINEELHKKRFFIVIDGLWISYWDDIEDAFPVDCGVSSRVIVTTATHSIATKCSVLDGHIYVMRSLNDKDARELFFQKAKLQFPPKPDDTELGSQVIKKCDGLPLALVTTARVLRGNPAEVEWEDLGKNLAEYMEDKEELVSMQHVLNRSYTSLGSQEIKTCLLYLGIYPSGHPIRTGSLIRKWLAEGFIKENHNTKVSPLEVAVRNLNELVNQSIIQPIINVSSSNNSTVVKTCQTQGMMLEFILHKSRPQNFVTLYGQDIPSSQHSKSKSIIRWLSIQYNAISKMDPEDQHLVRSLTIFGQAHNSLLEFSKYKLIKVLDLVECRVAIEAKHLKDICINLVLLRYLSLGAAVTVTELPGEIKMLVLLETLDVRRTKISILPAQAMQLPCLVHLFGKLKLEENRGLTSILNIKRDRTLSEWLSKNSKLETLAGFVVDKRQEMPQLIEDMEHLTKLKLWCESTPIIDQKYHLRKAIQGFIERGTTPDNAPSLSLNFSTEWHQELLFFKLKKDRFYYLRSLKLQGNIICSSLPWFLHMLGGLTKLCLSFPRHKMSTQFLDALRQVKRLEYLKLVAAELGKLIFGEDTTRVLRRLCVVTEVMTGLEIQKGALRCLQSLGVLCKDLNCITGKTIQSMPLLDEVTLHNRVSYQTKQDWIKESKDHPRRPKVLFAETKLIKNESAMDITFVALATDTMADGVAMPANAIPTQESEPDVNSEIASEPATTNGDGQPDDGEKKDDSNEFATENGCAIGTESSEAEMEGDDQHKKDDTRINTRNKYICNEPPIDMELEVLNTMFERSNVNGTSSLKTRPRSPTSAITCSPSKLRKNNVPEDFVDHITSEGRNATKDDEIAAIMEEVLKCGASEMSDEFYMATKLFDIPANRSFFYSMKTSLGRLNWLTRQSEDRKRN